MTSGNVVLAEYRKNAQLAQGDSILDAAKKAEIEISAVCGGRGLCGKCRIVVKQGSDNLEPVTHLEMMSLSQEELNAGYRLACCALLNREGTTLVGVPPESRAQQQRLLVAGIETAVSRNPSVKKFLIHLSKPSLEDIKSDAEVLLDGLSRERQVTHASITYEALTQLPTVLREGDWSVTVTMRDGSEVICVEPKDTTKRTYGLAVDVGSTKIASYLLDLNEGKVVATASAQNPQIPFGEDIISRVSYASKSEKNLRQLQGVVIACINKLLFDTCESAGVNASETYDVVLVGNTVMHHVCLGINPRFVALSPYPPAIKSSVSVRARDLGLKTNPAANVYVLPNVAGFVGADAVADVLATEIHRSTSLSIMIDVGTNTEIVLGNDQKTIACSCASGPAFEGGHIEFGMRAEPGAIENVYVDPSNLEPGFKTVGDERPRGICGSGIVDAVAAMLKSGIINKYGLINTKLNNHRILTDRAPRYVLSWKEENDLGHDIAVTQHDVQEIQLAKAAIYAGATILMKHLRVEPHEIQKVFLAGAFGTYVDPQSAVILGMYPDVPLERVQFVGNAAGSGARMALLSREVRENADRIVQHIDYVELAADTSFEREFTEALQLPHKDMTRFPTVAQLIKRD
ncbi:MAG TPA: ASKHA domain-containing protein [Candidatus Acidoferrales bacterium]|nr:ASKHA domain-containing protein [Candidatus Acidoferrales bacterium]